MRLSTTAVLASLVLMPAACQREAPAPATGSGAPAAVAAPAAAPRNVQTPGLQVTTLDGAQYDLADRRGKWVIVNFWATWCAPCREEIPLFVELQKKYGERGLLFVGIAIDQPDKVRPYAQELGMNFPILMGGAEAIDLSRSLGNRMGVLPYTVVLDRQGAIAAREVGAVKADKFEPLVGELL